MGGSKRVRIEQEDEDNPEGVDVAVEQDRRPQSEMVQALEWGFGRHLLLG